MFRKIFVILVLVTCSFFAGVNYSDAIKKNYSWIFEVEESIEESRTELPAITQPVVIENQEPLAIEVQEKIQPQESETLEAQDILLDELPTEQ